MVYFVTASVLLAKVDKGGGGGIQYLLMNVLVPISAGGERTGEPQYTSTVCGALPDEDRKKFLNDLENPESGVCFEFTGDEGRRLRDKGRFNGPEIGGYATQLTGVRTRTFVDDDGDTMIELRGQFRQDTSHPIANNTVVGTVFPHQLTRVLDDILTTKPLGK